jgi:hypothetical protein
MCRFDTEGDVPVVYCYELQVDDSAQGKGLGKRMMQLMELLVSHHSLEFSLICFPFTYGIDDLDVCKHL